MRNTLPARRRVIIKRSLQCEFQKRGIQALRRKREFDFANALKGHAISYMPINLSKVIGRKISQPRTLTTLQRNVPGMWPTLEAIHHIGKA